MKHSGLPNWMNYVQRTFLLTFLILAEAYLLGYLMTLGWVKDIEAPASWGWFHTIGVVLFFLAGATCAGIALNCSIKAATCFQNKQAPLALFNLLGLFGFCGAELWASLSERSANLAPSPADVSVLSWLGVANSHFSVSVVVVAFLLPFASLYYGFSQINQQEETAEALALRLEKDRLRALAQGEIGAIKAANRRKIVKAYTQDAVEEAPPSPVEAPAFAAVIQEEKAPEVVEIGDPKLPENRWNAKLFRAWLLTVHNLEISEEEAVKFVKNVGGGQTNGRAFIAPIGRLRQRAVKEYRLNSTGKATDIAPGFGEQMAE
jgi:hypothetical protein